MTISAGRRREEKPDPAAQTCLAFSFPRSLKHQELSAMTRDKVVIALAFLCTAQESVATRSVQQVEGVSQVMRVGTHVHQPCNLDRTLIHHVHVHETVSTGRTG